MPCTTILVGKKASNDSSTIIARNDDGNFTTKRVVSVSSEETLNTYKDNKYKSVISHLEIELPANPMRYTACPNVDTKSEGVWAACGINEANVAMTATETITSNPRVLGADPYVVYKKETVTVEVDGEMKEETKETPGGIGEEDLVILTLPYIKTAREGAERVGELLTKYGTYEPNGMAFSDENEIWWLESIGGHHFIAVRVPDDKVVIMPNQFGLDYFDFEDAYGEKKNCICSADLKEFVKENNLDLGMDGEFNPRLAFGSHSDADHLYNTPRAWYMGRYFLPRTYIWDGCCADFTPESNDIPWSFTPESKVTVQDVRYVLSSHYQGTCYDPYGKQPEKGKYRTIGVPNSDVSVILQIRNNVANELKPLEWVTIGGGGFTASIPLYTHVNSIPKYLSETPKTVDTNYGYWQSRVIAALVDAHFGYNVVFDERYQNTVNNQGCKLVFDYDKKFNETKDLKVLEEANEKIVEMLKKESDKVLDTVLETSSNHMKTRFNRNDN